MADADEVELQILQAELNEKLDSISPDADEADQISMRRQFLEEYADKIAEIKFQARLRKAGADSSNLLASASTTTIVAEQTTKIKLTTINAENIHRFSDQLVDHKIRTGKDFSSDQIKIMMDETNRQEITNHLKAFRFADGDSIDGAANWLKWSDNQKISDLLKLVFPRSEMQSDAQKILSSVFKIFCVKDPRHVLTWMSKLQVLIHYNEREEEFAQLSAQAFQNLHDTLVEQCIGRSQDTCHVTKYFVNAIKARAPTTVETLFEVIADEGRKLHQFALRCDFMKIPFLPYKKPSEKEATGNDPKRQRVDTGGGRGRGFRKRGTPSMPHLPQIS